MQLELIVLEPDKTARPTPVLFLHGMWHGAWCWQDNFMPFFAESGYRCFALSLRGHAGSEGIERLRRWGVRNYLDDIAWAIEQIGAPPVLVGHSMGGGLAQLALERDASLPGAVLLAATPPHGLLPTALRYLIHHPWLFAKINLTASMWPVVENPRVMAGALFSFYEPETAAQYHTRVQDESFRAFVELIVWHFPHPSRIHAPVLVLGAEQDGLIAPEEVRRTAKAYGVEPTLYPNMGHNMMMEPGWQQVGYQILTWFDQHGW